MPGRLRIYAKIDIGDTAKDLQAIGDGLDQPLTDAFEYAGRVITESAHANMRHAKPSWPTSSAARMYGSGAGVISSYYDSQATSVGASIFSRHPAAPVWEWGGTIHPLLGRSLHRMIAKSPQAALRLSAGGHDRPPWTFEIPRLEPVARAGAEREQEITDRLEQSIDELIEANGF